MARVFMPILGRGAIILQVQQPDGSIMNMAYEVIPSELVVNYRDFGAPEIELTGKMLGGKVWEQPMPHFEEGEQPALEEQKRKLTPPADL